ncbi:GTPase HflX [Aquella oligotrophica]|uniref:GTPase HflX n=1 Tax=Aquella oligotrophica TaxID=2067065 RepID=A0A2I7N5J5_9NEIS|nr:GTPase HflX [Aquella oligotrophica]AUR51736.1 GTPase HflX [Aquella oligotrophica]
MWKQLNKLIEQQFINAQPLALIVAINFNRNPDFDDDVSEALALAESAGYKIGQVITANRDRPDVALFVGSGKAEEIKSICDSLNPDVVMINHNISPVQERNLDRILNRRVIDRTQLILDIFAARATTNEGILQVELAQQSYLLTRLVRRWSHLERQRGGIGLRGGPGETQMELDKRMIATKVESLKKRLATIVKQRNTQRKSRLKSGIGSVSIVGYTNAGKSTLFNSLTKANVYAENRLFATLDTTTRRLFIDEEHEVILSDTVGFIRDLPHKLVAAFRATLEETIYANILLHVVDASNQAKERQIEDVNIVLTEIEANHIPQLMVYNKIDLIDGFSPQIIYAETGEPAAVYISASKNLGFDLLRQAIVEKMDYQKLVNEHKQDLSYEPWKNR